MFEYWFFTGLGVLIIALSIYRGVRHYKDLEGILVLMLFILFGTAPLIYYNYPYIENFIKYIEKLLY